MWARARRQCTRHARLTHDGDFKTAGLQATKPVFQCFSLLCSLVRHSFAVREYCMPNLRFARVCTPLNSTHLISTLTFTWIRALPPSIGGAFIHTQRRRAQQTSASCGVLRILETTKKRALVPTLFRTLATVRQTCCSFSGLEEPGRHEMGTRGGCCASRVSSNRVIRGVAADAAACTEGRAE